MTPKGLIFGRNNRKPKPRCLKVTIILACLGSNDGTVNCMTTNSEKRAIHGPVGS
ncbi:hypothetical protein TIFTF001_052603 [Ficus carica]|uniref:Uncharacterized protein n=1 Tax=Ficus carica TaxID=3494 RepID=A0AA88EA71_FICCA|nr:hypothetical protein TIFTF001_052603 [Ficus carica]